GGARRAPVVQQQNVARPEAARQPAEDALRTAADRVEAAPRPAHQAQVSARQRRLEEGIAQSRGGAKELRHLPGRREDRLLRAGDLVRERARPEEREAVEMALTVVLDGMAALDGLARQRGVPVDPLADAEEGRARAVLIEQREHARRDVGI